MRYKEILCNIPKKIITTLRPTNITPHMAILLALVMVGAFFRFFNITKIGVMGCDVFQYWKVGKFWAEGNFTLTDYYLQPFYRPGIYILHAMALKAFGYTDWALKVLHASMDIINIFLIYVIAKRIMKNKWLALATLIPYALSTVHFTQAKLELIHLPSETFVLLSILFFFNYFHHNIYAEVSKKNYFHLIISGVFLSYAAHIHPDLGFLGLGFVSFIALIHLRNYKVWTLSKIFDLILKHWSVFTLSFLSLFIIGSFFYGPIEIAKALMENQSIMNIESSVTQTPFIVKYMRVLTVFVHKTSSWFTYILFLTIPLFILIKKLKKKNDILLAYFPFFMISTHVLGYTLFSATDIYQRIFIPLVPLVFISITYWFYHFLKLFIDHKKSLGVTIGLFAFMAAFNMYPYEKEMFFPHAPTIHREVHNVIGDKVNSENKILIAPYLTYSHRRGFQEDMYFGTNARYILDATVPFKEYISNNKIKYMYVVSRYIDPKILKKTKYRNSSFPGSPTRKVTLGLAYGLTRSEFTQEKEKAFLMNYISKNHLKLIHKSIEGELYLIP